MSPAALSGPTLRGARPQDWPCIENLLQFYHDDLSRWYPIPLGADGRYAVAAKADYLGLPDTRAWLVLVDAELAGFAVVDGDLIDAGCEFNLGYFFIARRFRGRGIGAAAFAGLLERHPGAWELSFLARNGDAAAFWPKALARTGVRELEVSHELVRDEACVMHRFASPAS